MEKENPRNKLKYYRERARMTQRDLMKKSGVSKFAIGRIEGGYNVPRYSTMNKLAEALKVDVNELFPLPEEDAKSAGNFRAPAVA